MNPRDKRRSGLPAPRKWGILQADIFAAKGLMPPELWIVDFVHSPYSLKGLVADSFAKPDIDVIDSSVAIKVTRKEKRMPMPSH
jgi:hypothetical protein